MWKLLEGAKAPGPKKRKTVDKVDRSKLYEEKNKD